MNLNELQTHLERVYDVNTPHRVEDFLLHDPVLASVLSGERIDEQMPEKLLLRQEDDTVDVSVFLDPALLARLACDNPARNLHSGNFQDFLLALEGVSHFLYLAWSAGLPRTITLLEMELQAEVDKFVTTLALVHQQGGGIAPRRLWRALFEEIRFRRDLDEHQRARYHESNRLGARYCLDLERRFRLDLGDADLVRELRRFYRLPRADKVRHIESSMLRSP